MIKVDKMANAGEISRSISQSATNTSTALYERVNDQTCPGLTKDGMPAAKTRRKEKRMRDRLMEINMSMI